VQVSLDWLSESIEVPPLATLCELLNRAGVAVEGVVNPAAAVSGVVVGEVTKAEPHPKADRLRLCEIYDGSERFQVVCGAPNVAVGQRVPFARVGAKLPGFLIERRAIRGIE